MYAAYAHTPSIASALISPHLYYWSAVANVATVAAMRAVPLETPPFVTLLAAFLFQIVPIGIVLFAKSDLWDGRIRRTTLCALVILSATGEIWLTTLAAQFHLALAAGLILLVNLERSSPWQRGVFLIVLAGAGLSGPGDRVPGTCVRPALAAGANVGPKTTSGRDLVGCGRPIDGVCRDRLG